MRTRTDSGAREDLEEPRRWYRTRSIDLERRLRREYSAVRSRIREYPYAGAADEHGFRRMSLASFPYTVIYEVQEHEIVIIAFAHFKRRQGYWRD